MPSNYGTGEDSWGFLGQQGDQTSQSQGKSTPNTHWKDWCWSWNSSILVIWHKLLTYGKDWRQKEKRRSEEEMAAWHHRLNGRDFEWAPGVGEGQGGLVCCSPWGHKESDMTGWLNNKETIKITKLDKFTLWLFIEQSVHTCGGGGGGLVTKSCPTLETPWTVAHQAHLSMGFPRQEYWSGLPFLPLY